MFLGFVLGVSITMNAVLGYTLTSVVKNLKEKEKNNESPADVEQK